MTRVDLVRLAALAAEATPGPWQIYAHGEDPAGVAAATGPGWVDWICEVTNQGEDDAAFLAACHPGVVAALVEAVQAARDYLALSTYDARNALNLKAANRLAAALAVFGDESPQPFEAQSDENPSDVRGGGQP